MTDWSRVIGIFGGSFDPPHSGHRAAVAGLFARPGLKKVWVMPSGNPPWKTASSPARDRLEMARLAFSGLDEVEVLDWELELATRSPAEPTTTWRTLEFIAPRLHEAELAWVLGTDQLLGLDRWDRFPEVLGRCHWIVLLRRGLDDAEAAAFQKMAAFESAGMVRRDPRAPDTWNIAEHLAGGRNLRIALVRTDAPEASSTAIREEAARTGDIRASLAEKRIDPAVAGYLKEKKLYGTRNHDL